MKLTYTDLLNQYLRNIGKAGSTDATIIADFQLNMGQRYQTILSHMGDYLTQIQKSAATVAAQQYYHYPSGIVNIASATITIGTQQYPLDVINSQKNWDALNSFQFQGSAIPQFIFPRRDDFGIWPIPQDVYTITFNYHLRDRNMLVADYTTGTVTVANNSQTITGSSTVFTSAMAGRWFQITSTSQPGEGYWYKVSSFTSTTVMTLETSFEGSSGSGLSYRIGQTPLIPEEGHILLVDGPTADFYAGLRSDIKKATWFNNKFWTGDGNNPNRKEVKAGLLGLENMYGNRNRSRLIQRKPRRADKAWGVSIT